MVDATDAKGPRLPSVNPDELKHWREIFAEEYATGLEEADTAALEVWERRSLPTHFLPKKLQGEWNATLKRRILQRLQGWFEANDLNAPPDLIVQRQDTHTPASPVQAEQLRAFVLEVVANMTLDELGLLTLPAGAVWRVQAHQPR